MTDTTATKKAEEAQAPQSEQTAKAEENISASTTVSPTAELPDNTPTWVKAAIDEGGANQYLVDLDLFHGPMELLLYLIKKDELDLHDIPVAKITAQYLEYVEVIHELDLETAGEFILMAATLIRIKTRMLLPRDENDPDELDPREELVMALLEYRRFKEASESLRELRETEEAVFVPERKQIKYSDGPGIPSNTVYQLIEAFKEVMIRVENQKTEHVTQLEPVSVNERVEQITTLLTKSESATFAELFADAQTKIVVIVTLIALLEMAKARRLTFQQINSFSELRVYRGESFYDEGDIIVDEWEGEQHDAAVTL
ncbi:segregation/condensation protein A [bacterium AH-315-J21]|nr:segregation/condensation protein A [bacterium AH-315-J21]